MTDGNYENELKQDIITDTTCKRLLGAMQFGIIITHGNGHRWIYSMNVDECDQGSLNYQLRAKGKPVIREKCYGTVIDALDRVDGALKVLGRASLLEQFESDVTWDAWG